MKKLLSVLIIGAMLISALAGCINTNADAEENYVALDMGDAAVQFVVNGNDEVLSFSAATPEGEEVIFEEEYVGCDISDSVGDVIENAVELGYLDPDATEEDPNGVMITTEPSKERFSARWKERMINCVDAKLSENGIWALVLGAEDIDEINALAEQYNMSPSRVRIAMAIRSVNPDFTFEEAAEMSASRIMAMLRAGKPVKAKIKELKEQVKGLENELDTLNETDDAERINEINAELEKLNTKLEELEAVKNSTNNFREQKKAAHQQVMEEWKREKQKKAETIKQKKSKNQYKVNVETKNKKKAEIGKRIHG